MEETMRSFPARSRHHGACRNNGRQNNWRDPAVFARGVYRAGYVGPNGAFVARRPVAACSQVLVNGVRVRRCS